MAWQRRVVFEEASTGDRLPDWAGAGVALLEWLQCSERWRKATDLLRVQREGGYAGIDALLFLLYYFTSGLNVGIKEFSEQARRCHPLLAAVGDRRRLPTQASMSRILRAVEPDLAAQFGRWLLVEGPGIEDVLRHPSVRTLDARGVGWHVFDWDPTVTTLRHRALPVCEDTPDGRRRSKDLAKPGYSGRKRGDVQFSRATLQHAGSALWLGIDMGAGNGALRSAFHTAVEQVIATIKHVGLDQERALLRADGVGGNVPFITACAEAGLHYVTRLAHYQLLQDERVLQHLNAAVWYEVPSSGSGPTRYAADLGRVTLEPAATSVKEDGSIFEPVEVRVVVSRFRSGEDGRGAGVTLDGWQYELYGTDLPRANWPEGEIVAGYYGRCGQENRFHQEDRELGLDRIFSYSLAGQQLATVVGLFVWNYRICRGFEVTAPPSVLPTQDVATSEPAPAVVIPRSNSTAPDPTDTGGQNTAQECEEPERSTPNLPPNERSESAATRHDVISALDEIDWTQILRGQHREWVWLAHRGGLRCPAKAFIPLKRIENVQGKPIRARFVAHHGTCDACKLRAICVRSDDPHYRKDVRLPLPEPNAKAVLDLWRKVPAAAEVRRRRVPTVTSPGAPRPVWRMKQLSWRPPDQAGPHPALAVRASLLLPAVLRQSLRSITRLIEAHVRVESPQAAPSLCPAIAASTEARQRRRLSWSDRLAWNTLPDEWSVSIRLLGAERLEPLMRSATAE